MAIEFGTGLHGAANALFVRTPSVRRAEFRSSDSESQGLRTDQANTDAPRLGFGEGTVSSLGVAATTVDRNLEAARKIVPTLDELSDEARARTQEVRKQAAETEQARLDRVSENSQRNENAARAQTVGFEQPKEESAPLAKQSARETQQLFGPSAREVDSVVSFVVPDPVASFDVFG